MSNVKFRAAHHAFMSFSGTDRDIALKLGHDLARHIPIWIAPERLVPGTDDWETAIRDAIDDSFVVLLVASPHARKSRYVRGELEIAEAKRQRIIPLWVRGDDWSDCVPLGMTKIQFIDLREPKDPKVFERLVAELDDIRSARAPKHYLIQPAWKLNNSAIGTMRISDRHGTFNSVDPPPGYIAVEIAERPNEPRDGGSVAAFKLAEYHSARAILDDLYVHYLSNRFKPFTYGEEWILAQDVGFGFYSIVLAPWALLTAPPNESWSVQTMTRNSVRRNLCSRPLGVDG
jgi:TIR domain